MIYFAVTGAPVMLTIVLTLTFSQPEKNATDDMSLFIFGGVALFFSLTTFALSVIFPPMILKSQIKPGMPLPAKLSVYRTYFILKLAISEASCTIYLIFFIPTENILFITGFFAFALIIFFILKPPTEDKIIQTLSLSPEEVSQIS